MGLGKTAATLSVHLLNPPTTDGDEAEWGKLNLGTLAALNSEARTKQFGSKLCKGTLVVCAVSLVGQWVEEARRLCNNTLTIYPYHGGSRIKDPKKLAEYDIIVTTYGIVETDCRRMQEGKVPPLQAIRFWRIVLDESHTIKGSNQQTQAVNTLIGNRRWLVSGTPCNNRYGGDTSSLHYDVVRAWQLLRMHMSGTCPLWVCA
jgi:SNF2 family DNA or RNA helicase